jgi:mannose-6-phosphate isomerase-like protein (cupin superfamily)
MTTSDLHTFALPPITIWYGAESTTVLDDCRLSGSISGEPGKGTAHYRGEKQMDVSVEEMEKRVARWGKVKPYEQTFIESRLPGFEKRLYKIINRGVLENKGVEPAIVGSHRFGVTLIEVPFGQGANLHSHKTEEVFFPLNGKMLLVWGEKGEHQLMLNQWDCISVPVGVMRGFRNPNDHDLVIYSVVGGRDEEVGRIEWHPDVIKAGESTGLAYDEKGYIEEKVAR